MTRTTGKKHMTLIAVLTGGTLAAIGVVAMAEARGPQGGHPGKMIRGLFERFDTDQDESVSRTEVDSKRAESLRTHDGDRDGALSLDEFEGMWIEMQRRRMVDAFQDLDEDGSGLLTAEEMNARTERLFARVDADGDGAITREEVQALRGRFHRRHGPRRGGPKDDQ